MLGQLLTATVHIVIYMAARKHAMFAGVGLCVDARSMSFSQEAFPSFLASLSLVGPVAVQHTIKSIMVKALPAIFFL